MRQRLLTSINQAQRNFSRNSETLVNALDESCFDLVVKGDRVCCMLLEADVKGVRENKLWIEGYLQGLWDEFVALCGIGEEDIVDEASDTEDDEPEIESGKPEEPVLIVTSSTEQDIVDEAPVTEDNETEVETAKPKEPVSIITSSTEQDIVDEAPVTENNETKVVTGEPESIKQDIVDEAPVTEDNVKVETAEPKESVSIITSSTDQDIVDEAPDTEDNETKAVTGESEEPVSIITSSLRSYREAISNNDESKAAEIEAFIISIEDGLKNKIATLSKELSYERDRVVRVSADFDNFRERTERERLSLVTNAQGEVVESLLPVVDNFERAKSQFKIENEGEEEISNSYQSVEILDSLEVVPVNPVGTPFDPLGETSKQGSASLK